MSFSQRYFRDIHTLREVNNFPTRFTYTLSPGTIFWFSSRIFLPESWIIFLKYYSQACECCRKVGARRVKGSSDIIYYGRTGWPCDRPHGVTSFVHDRCDFGETKRTTDARRNVVAVLSKLRRAGNEMRGFSKCRGKKHEFDGKLTNFDGRVKFSASSCLSCARAGLWNRGHEFEANTVKNTLNQFGEKEERALPERTEMETFNMV